MRKLEKSLAELVKTRDTQFQLLFELTVMVHYGRPLAKACYFLEGDDVLLPYLDEHLRFCRRKLATDAPLDPHVITLIEMASPERRPQWTKFARMAIRPAHDYLINQDVKHGSNAWALPASYFLPWRYRELRPSEAQVRDGFLLGFGRALPLEIVQGCVSQMELYDGIADGIVASPDVLPFWKARRADLEFWFQAFTIVGLIQPSSAAAERGFSEFQLTFGDSSSPDVLEDYMEASLMLKINRR